MTSGNAIRCWVRLGLCLGLLAAVTIGHANGQKSKPKAKTQPKAKSKTKAPAFPKKTGKKTPKKKTTGKPAVKVVLPKPDAKALVEWKQLDSRRRVIRTTLRRLKSEFEISSRAAKLKIKKEFESLIKEWIDDIRPKMVKLSLDALLDDPESELASQLAVGFPNQQRVVDLTELLIKAGKDGGTILRLAGLANFYVNRFERSAALLEQARDKNARIGLTLDLARDYVKYSKTEAELRKKEKAAPKDKQLPLVVIRTSKGNVKVELFENEVPNTVANFITLIEKKFYDGQHIHNVEPLVAVEAGDPKTKPKYDKDRTYGFGGPGYTINSESTEDNARMHFRGSLSMISYGKDTEGSLFSILLRPMPRWNPNPGGLSGRTVFGRVIEGMDVVDKLEPGDKIDKIEVLQKRPHPYKVKTSLDKDDPPVFPKKKDKTAPRNKKTPKKNKPFPKSKTTPKKGQKTDKKPKTKSTGKPKPKSKKPAPKKKKTKKPAGKSPAKKKKG